MGERMPFADLAPPPGGLRRLRERLDRARRRPPLAWTLVPALGAAVALALFLAPARGRRVYRLPQLAGEPVVALAGSSTAVERISGGAVLVYRVASLP